MILTVIYSNIKLSLDFVMLLKLLKEYKGHIKPFEFICSCFHLEPFFVCLFIFIYQLPSSYLILLINLFLN